MTEVAYLFANGVRLARLAYEPPGDVPSINGENLHVFFELGDHLGSTSVVLDKATGELVERSTYQAYGGTESDYRPERWKSFREDYRFTGKEEDVEAGLIYFGKRFLNPLLNRWVSADPLAVHGLGADPNLYAYVSGRALQNVDPLGLEGSPPAHTTDAGAEKKFLEDTARSGNRAVGIKAPQDAQEIGGYNEAMLSASSRKSSGELDGDHVVSLDHLRKDRRFQQLTLEQQLQVANTDANLVKLDAGVNRSKGGRSLSEFLDDLGSDNKIARGVAKRAEQSVEKRIRDFTKANQAAGKSFNRRVVNADFLNANFTNRHARALFKYYRSVMSAMSWSKVKSGSWIKVPRRGVPRPSVVAEEGPNARGSGGSRVRTLVRGLGHVAGVLAPIQDFLMLDRYWESWDRSQKGARMNPGTVMAFDGASMLWYNMPRPPGGPEL